MKIRLTAIVTEFLSPFRKQDESCVKAEKERPVGALCDTDSGSSFGFALLSLTPLLLGWISCGELVTALVVPRGQKLFCQKILIGYKTRVTSQSFSNKRKAFSDLFWILFPFRVHCLNYN